MDIRTYKRMYREKHDQLTGNFVQNYLASLFNCLGTPMFPRHQFTLEFRILYFSVEI